LEREWIFKDDITKDIFWNMSEPASRYGWYLKDIWNYMCHEDEIYNIAKEVKRKYDNLK
jgi:hypothetical protein